MSATRSVRGGIRKDEARNTCATPRAVSVNRVRSVESLMYKRKSTQCSTRAFTALTQRGHGSTEMAVRALCFYLHVLPHGRCELLSRHACLGRLCRLCGR